MKKTKYIVPILLFITCISILFSNYLDFAKTKKDVGMIGDNIISQNEYYIVKIIMENQENTNNIDEFIHLNNSLFIEAKNNNFEANYKKYYVFIDKIKTNAKSNNMTVNEYLKYKVGFKISLSDFKEITKKYFMAFEYSDFLYKNITIPNEELIEKSNINKEEYKTYSYIYAQIPNNSEDEESIIEKTNELINKSYNSNIFKELTKEYFDIDIEDCINKEGNQIPSEIKSWIIDSRNNDDIAAIKANDSIFIIYFIESNLNSYKKAKINYFYIPDETTTNLEQTEKISNYNENKIIIDEFKEIINHTFNNYEEKTMLVGKNVFSQEFNEWAFNQELVSGDIFHEINNGINIYYFIGYDEVYAWERDVINTYKKENYEQMLRTITEKYPYEINYEME